ncbi:uncharacterized protein LOC127649418 [Xyrauchen texanus]|uniref:uncharacterized protein LOC127649418 n=1 Tax=Xyrauchen texanus TaxID=154827 RepID=UPI0022424080|nr:uncharacterized protein LOC127649418 [Xyrauchen texanus]XP_051990452.1 uncharacterized protein LOC127649418 [Xyrauchen texanus]XP_051990453.1 uncharacterized protein LOC127649418 [Xyrauchen texanus]
MTIFPSGTMYIECKSKAPRRTDPAEEFLKLYGQSQPSSDNHNSLTQTVVELKQEIKDLKEENAKLKEIVLQDVPGLLLSLRNIIDSAAPPKRSRVEPTTALPALPGSPQSRSSSPCATSLSLPRSTLSSSTSVSPSLTASQSSKVEIYPGTGVMVEKLAWAYALNANSATVFVRHLLTAVFPVERLLVSNLRGNKRGGGEARRPLDKNKLDAIYTRTTSQHTERKCSG